MQPVSSPPGPAETRPPVVTKAPPSDRKFPCQKCGARLDFDPSSHSLKCPYCGFVEHIEPSAKGVQERDWDEYWRNAKGSETTLEGHSSQVTCTVCGAVVLLDDKVAADRCPYCGSFLENQPVAAQSMIAPEGALPFTVTEHQAVEAFIRWIAGRWFAPRELYQFAALGKLNGVYVPFWTYDAMTFTHYTGQRGDDYMETETYTETDANGQTVTKTRQVTKTRWTWVSGQVRHFFDDVLICGSRSVPEGLMGRLGPWDLKKLEDYKPEYLSGFQAERYAIGLKEGFDQARGIMDAHVRQLCCQQIGGNHQRLDSVQTQYSGITFKHILLPAWLAAYRYRDRTYQVLLNGRTGKVVGARPYSWIKITLLVLVIALAIVAVVLFFAARARGASMSQRPEPELQMADCRWQIAGSTPTRGASEAFSRARFEVARLADSSVLSPNGAGIGKPRAAPWEGRDNRTAEPQRGEITLPPPAYCVPLGLSVGSRSPCQGAALGFTIPAPLEVKLVWAIRISIGSQSPLSLVS
jgi:DNA-directed RNA polymerase subunit RPC12/RpoP